MALRPGSDAVLLEGMVQQGYSNRLTFFLVILPVLPLGAPQVAHNVRHIHSTGYDHALHPIRMATELPTTLTSANPPSL